MRLLKTFRFDASDERVFERAAMPGEWAVPGAFAFTGTTPEDLHGKRRQAFRSGFFGLESFGWSTLAVIVDINAATCDALALRLAEHFVDVYGAPSVEAALPAAREEIGFAGSLCVHPVNTLLLVEREIDEEGHVRESFRTVVRRSEPAHARIWEIVGDDGGQSA
jgi:hypothetical protein